jgi:hypothetical protein
MSKGSSSNALAISYISVAIALFGAWLVASKIWGIAAFVLALFFTLLAIIAFFSAHTPKWVTDFLWALDTVSLRLFVGITMLGVGLMGKVNLSLGQALIYIAYCILGAGMVLSMLRIKQRRAVGSG